MKLKYQNIVTGALAMLCAASCSDMNEKHEQYLDGAIIYAAKVDSATVQAGRNRVQLNLDVRSQRIDRVRIFWNGYADSSDVAVNSRVGLFREVFANMAENSYVFYLVSYDKYGNPSLPFETTGNVYGDRFQSILVNRGVTSFYAGDEGLRILWGGAPDNSLGCQLISTGKDGREQAQLIPVSETSTLIADGSSGLSYRTLYLPEATAIDTFYTEWRALQVPTLKYPTAGWTVASRNGNHPWGDYGGEPERVIDGDIKTAWHSYTGGPLPQCLVVDMKETKPVGHVILRNLPEALANNWIYVNNVEVYLTDNPATPDVYQSSWGKPAARYYFPGGYDVLSIPLDPGSSGRYLIIYFLDSKNNTYINFAELDVYRD